MPEISTSRAETLGRETLFAIAEDEAEQARAALKQRKPSPPQEPSISYRQTEAGRETLAAINRELTHATPGTLRPAMSTLDFEARPRRATVGFDEQRQPQPPQPPPSSRAPKPPSHYRETSAPEIEIGYVPAVRLNQLSSDSPPSQPSRPAPPPPSKPSAASKAALSSQLRSTESLPAPQPHEASLLDQLQSAEVSEAFSFIIRGAPLLARASLETRLQFVQTRLLHRLPVKSVSEIVAIDISPRPSDGALQLVVWVPIKTRS